MYIFFAILFVIAVICIIDYKRQYKKPKNKAYARLLKDRRWYEKRIEILKRDNYKCTECGSGDNLCVHHKYYLKNAKNNYFVYPWDYPNEALTTLCKECHKEWHMKNKNLVYYRK